MLNRFTRRLRAVNGSGHGPAHDLDRGPEDGRILLLVIIYVMISLLLVAAVTAATGVHLERKRLLALADQTALAAAVAVDGPRYYTRDGARLVQITARGAQDAAEAHLAASETTGLHGLRLATTWTDGHTAEATLTAVAHPPLIGWLTQAWSDGIPLRATSRARAG